MTFKDLRKIITERKKELERESKFYDPNYFWEGKRIVSLDEWYQVKEGYGLKAALQFFPNDYRYGFACTFDNIEDMAAIFIGINKVISRALDADGVPIYPCKILNRFACPYDKKITKDIVEDGITEKPDVDHLFHLSELAFAVELALAKAQEEDRV